MHHSGGESKAQSSYSTARWELAERAVGLRLSDEAVRVAVGLILGSTICQPHTCICGTQIDARGLHGLSCRKCGPRHIRHSQLNDLIWRAIRKAQIPATKEPVGLISNGWEEAGRRDAHPLDTRQTACMGRRRSEYLRSVSHCRNSGERSRSSNKGSSQQINKICLPYSNAPLRSDDAQRPRRSQSALHNRHSLVDSEHAPPRATSLISEQQVRTACPTSQDRRAIQTRL